MKTNKTTLAVMIASCFGSGVALAEETQDSTKILSPVVVTATRVEQDSFDLPMSIDKIEKKDIQDGQPRVSLSEALVRVPGVTAQYRNQNSSDLQISTRGFGARSSFGVRGVRLYVDGVPLSMPDGIGNPGSVDLGSIGGIEVMRGPFSALYGNSSGGVIQLFTDTPPASPEISADFYAGSFSSRRSSIQAAGTQGNVNYLISGSDSASNGYRTQSAWEKQQATARLGWQVSEDSKLTTIINWFQHDAQEPGGLLRTGTSSTPGALTINSFYNPAGSQTRAIAFNSHSEKGNTQIGFNFEKRIDGSNKLNIVTYGGQRYSDGYLAATSGGQNTGRLSKINRDFYGADVQGTNNGQLGGKAYILTYGVTAGYMEDLRKDIDMTYTAGTGTYTAGATNRNETQKAYNFDQYVQGTYALADRWDLHAGVRNSSIRMSIKDRLNTNNGNMSYHEIAPVTGIVFKATPTLNMYANLGKGFETPTLIESTYGSATSASGTNRDLKPSTSTNIEVGTKWMVSDNVRFNAAAFDISTDNEIVIAEQGTYTKYSNAGKTQRSGAEFSLEHRITSNVSAFVAYTYLDATYDKTFSYTNSNGTVTVNKGNYIPGTYRQQVYGEVAWKHQPIGFSSALEARYNSKAYVNDINTDTAPSYTIVNLRASLQQVTGKWRITEYARIENLFDKAYIGSVRVNDGAQRFFETAPGRNYIVGIKANYAF